MNRYTEAMNVRPTMTKDEAIAKFMRIYHADMTKAEFYDNHRELADYCIRFLGGLSPIFEIASHQPVPIDEDAGLEAVSHEVALPKIKKVKKYKPSYSDAKGIQREILRLWYIGYPLNYMAISRKRVGLFKGAKTLFGSWENAVNSVGIEYSTVMKGVNSNVLSECGTEFETLFAEILTELGYAYIREGEGISEALEDFALKPDFILPNWRWIDCKLSEWTDISETLKRYSKETPNGITIVYLRGKNRRVNRGRKWQYEHVSVYQFTKLLPEGRRKHYDALLNAIERKANEGAIAS